MAPRLPICTFLSHPQERDSGDYRHRVIMPGEALSRHLTVVDVQTTHPQFVNVCLESDLLIVKMVAEPVVGGIAQARRLRGLPTVLEISDDFRDFPTSLPGHAFYARPDIQAFIEHTAQQANLVQFASHGLQKKYGHLNPAHVVFANHLDQVPPLLPVEPLRLGVPVLGWAGSMGHLEDARQLAGWLKAWSDARPAASRPPRILLMAAEPLQQVFREAGLEIMARPNGTFEDYLAFLAEVDVGFAILGTTDFAACRSDGKFLEYASRGVICLASDRGEFVHTVRHGETGLLFSDQPSFVAALETVMNQPDLRQRIRQAAHDYVRCERTHALGAIERMAFYQPLLERAGRSFALGDPGFSGEFISLIDPSEGLLYLANVMHLQGRYEQALTGYMKVMQVHPGFHVPWDRSAMIARLLGAKADADYFCRVASDTLEAQLSACLEAA